MAIQKDNYILSNFNDSHQSQPWCIATFLAFTNPRQDVPLDNVMSVENITLVNDVLSANISSSKSSHISTCELTLSSGHINYQASVSPGDHVVVWMGDSADDYETVSKQAYSSAKANHFNSGMKFVGKVNSVRTIFTTDNVGNKSVRYLVTCKAFSEFDIQIYFNPLLKPQKGANESDLKYNTEFLTRVSAQWQNKLFSSGLSFQVADYIDFFIETFLGAGPSDDAKHVILSDGKKATTTATVTANGKMLIPNELESILGLDTNLTKSYAEATNRYWGIQQYSNQYEPTSNQSILGSMAPPPDMFNNTTLWSSLQSIGNLAINEMYTTLRSDNDGDIAMTYIVRQIPFTTGNFVGKKEVTAFKTLPRWKISTARCINSFNIGTSDQLRFNFIQIYGQFFGYNGKTPQESLYAQIAEGNLVSYNNDITRHGPRTLLQNTTCDVIGEGNTGLSVKGYRDLIDDWYSNGHLKLTGSITTSGIKQPICIGDNLEVEGKLFHIEGVTHQFSVTENGMKSFSTSMSLSHGIDLSNGYSQNDPKMRAGLNNDFVPGVSDEEDYVYNTKIVSGTEDNVKDQILQRKAGKKDL